MIRGSHIGFLVLKKDLESGLVLKKRHKEVIEYWVYRQKESSLVDRLGRALRLQNKESSYLYAIVVCSEEKDASERSGGFLIRGIKFTEEDINKYLAKTNRHVD